MQQSSRRQTARLAEAGGVNKKRQETRIREVCHALASRGPQGPSPVALSAAAGGLLGRFLGGDRRHGCAGLRSVRAKLSRQADPHIHSLWSGGRRRPDRAASRAEADGENKAAGRDRKSAGSRWSAF